MNIGGVHFFAGLFYLILSILCLGFYLLVPCMLLPIVQRGVALFKKGKRSEQWPWPLFWFVLPERRRALMGGMGMISLFFGSVYLHQRLVWMGSDNANFKAKEYFVAGQPLAGLRLIFCDVLNPDHPVLVPLNGLQKLIYANGTRYLPDNDGEIGAWEDLWFHYPFIKRMHDPYGTDRFHPSINMRRLLDRIYTAIEIMATRPFSDAQMESEQALRNLPRAAFYYSLNKGFYADRKVGSHGFLRQEVDLVEKTENLYLWMTDLRQRWIDAGIYQDIKTRTPKVELTRQLLAIHFSSDLLYAALYKGEFSCRHPLIPAYLSARRDFTDPKAPDYVWGRLHAHQPQQAELLYGMAIDTYSVSFFKYVLEEYCSLPVPGEERFYESRDKAFSQKRRVPRLKSIFHKEIKRIEEGFNER